jgi:hypothetical protein
MLFESDVLSILGAIYFAVALLTLSCLLAQTSDSISNKIYWWQQMSLEAGGGEREREIRVSSEQ